VRIPPVHPDLDRAAAWSWRLLVCAAAVGAVLALLWYLQVIVLPAIVAITIAPALMPLEQRLRRLGLGRAAPGLALVTGILVVAALVSLITVSVVQEYEELEEAVRQGTDDLVEWLEGPPLNLTLEGDRDLGESLRSAWGAASGYLVAGVRSGISVITGLVLAVALLYFILRDGRGMWRGLLRLFSPDARPRIDLAGQQAWATLGGYVRGSALIAAVDATLIGLGLWILGVPLVLALSVLVFLGGFIPFVGATISGMVAVLVALADGGVTTALLALAIVIGVQFVEGNFLQPVIQSRTVNLHPAIILLAVAAGGALYGIVGAYLAVPITAVAFAVFAAVRADPT
jgi:predicted PurR-regulated permease PerM